MLGYVSTHLPRSVLSHPDFQLALLYFEASTEPQMLFLKLRHFFVRFVRYDIR